MASAPHVPLSQSGGLAGHSHGADRVRHSATSPLLQLHEVHSQTPLRVLTCPDVYFPGSAPREARERSLTSSPESHSAWTSLLILSPQVLHVPVRRNEPERGGSCDAPARPSLLPDGAQRLGHGGRPPAELRRARCVRPGQGQGQTGAVLSSICLARLVVDKLFITEGPEGRWFDNRVDSAFPSSPPLPSSTRAASVDLCPGIAHKMVFLQKMCTAALLKGIWDHGCHGCVVVGDMLTR